MNLKDLFAKGENGALTYDQFVALATEGKAKFVDLSEGQYVGKQKYEDDLAQRDTRITDLTATIATRDTDLESLRGQLTAAGADQTKLADLDKQFKDLQSKYDADTAELQKKMQEQAYRHAVNDFAAQQKFTSKAAQRDFVNSMLSKNLTMENDVIIGATDFVATYTKDNADAFVVEKEETAGGKPKPQFTNPTNLAGGSQGNTTPFQFNFTGVRPHDK